MKLAEHNILTLRCAMTQLDYEWRRDPNDRSRRWDGVSHWRLWERHPGYDFQQIDLHPVVTSVGDSITTDVTCSVRLHPDGSLSEWLLMESYTGKSTKELDPWAYSLEDLPDVLCDWVTSWNTGERSSSA